MCFLVTKRSANNQNTDARRVHAGAHSEHAYENIVTHSTADIQETFISQCQNDTIVVKVFPPSPPHKHTHMCVQTRTLTYLPNQWWYRPLVSSGFPLKMLKLDAVWEAQMENLPCWKTNEQTNKNSSKIMHILYKCVHHHILCVVTECICTLCLCCCMYFGYVALSMFFRVCTSVDLLHMRYVLWFRRHYETSLKSKSERRWEGRTTTSRMYHPKETKK